MTTDGRAVFLKPRSWRLKKKPEEVGDRGAYPRWFTILARGTLTGLEIAGTIYTVVYHSMMQGLGEDSKAETSLAGLAIGAAFDGLFTLAALIGMYEAGGTYVAAPLDLVPAFVSLFGAFDVGIRTDWSYYHPDDPHRGTWTAIFNMSIAASVVHFVASIGGCVGCCILCKRDRRAQKIKKAMNMAIAGGGGVEAGVGEGNDTTALADLTPKATQNSEKKQPGSTRTAEEV